VLKTLLVLCVGVAIGYGYGFKDAKKHEKTVVSRAVDRIGGSNRGKYDQNIDQQADSIVR
jgi:hypothetical protein